MSNYEYREYADILLKIWMENILTDGEYNRIMDKLNAHWEMGKEARTNESNNRF